jgi:ATP-dependent RNA helicase SUPV3L1/SUV3
LSAPDKEKVKERLAAWIAEIVGERLKPLVEIAAAKDIAGLARGIAFRLSENFGALRREAVAEEMRALDQPARAQLRNYGVRFGAFNIYFPALLKPASAELALVLWALKNGTTHGIDMAAMPDPPRPGLTSLIADKAVPEAFYRVTGFHVCGPRAVRIDMLERLADQIRPLMAWRANPTNPNPPPKGATGDGGFRATPEMMSILGCSAGELGNVLQALGFRLDRVRIEPVDRVRIEPEPVEPAEAATNGAPAMAPADTEAAAAEQPAPTAEQPQPSDQQPAPPIVTDATPAAGEASATASEQPAADTTPPEVKWDEIWRPRRQGRQPQQHRRGAHARPQPKGDQTPQSQPKRSSRPDRRERRRDGPPQRRDDRPRTVVQSASPPAKSGADPDSPFAALRSLKLALEKPSQD